MFARCLHFWAGMLVSWDRQTLSHWSATVAHFRAGSRDAEGRGELQELSLSVPIETGPDGPTSPTPILPSLSLKSSHGGNTGVGRWIIGNFTPLKTIILSKTFQIYSSVESFCLS